MGTRSTVHFFEGNTPVLSLYNQYDGYQEGVGTQLAHTLTKHTNETSYILQVEADAPENEEKDIANGIRDLALLFVEKWKRGPYGMYLIDPSQYEEFNYFVYADAQGYAVEKVKVEVDDTILFEGTVNEYVEYIKHYTDY